MIRSSSKVANDQSIAPRAASDAYPLPRNSRAIPQPTSNPGQPGGNQGPTRPTNFPLVFSSTTNMPTPCNIQCPDMTAALRHPANSEVTGLPSAAMKRAVPGSESIAVFGAMSAPRHGRSVNRSVSITGPSDRASLTPGLRGGSIGLLPLDLARSCLPLLLHGAQAPEHEDEPRSAW